MPEQAHLSPGRARNGAILRAVVLTCVLAVLSPPVAVGAQMEQPSPGVVLPLELDVQNQIAAVDRLTERAQWQLALPLLQGILESSGDSLILHNGTYVPVTHLVRGRLDALPADGRSAYRILYDPPALRQYELALANRSLPALLEVARRYRSAMCGPQAASAAAGILMDQGEFAAALRVVGAAEGADAAPEVRVALLARKLACLAHMGRRHRMQELVGAATGQGLDRLQVGGRSWSLEDYADELLARLAPADATMKPEPLDITALAPRWLPLPWPEGQGAPLRSLPSTRPGSTAGRILAQVDGNLVGFREDNGRLAWIALRPDFQLDVAADVLGLDQYEDTLPLFLPVDDLRQWRTYLNHGLAGVATDGPRVYAVRVSTLDQFIPPEIWAAKPEEVLLRNGLACYDAETGAALWHVGRGARSPVPALADCWFLTAPAVHGGRAYVLAARSGVLSALCLDAVSGSVVWDRTIGPLESRQQVERFCMGFFLGDTNRPVVSDGVAVFPTGQGLICAFDAYTGEPAWCAPYGRAAASVNRLGTWIEIPAGPWTPTAAFVADGVVVLAAHDSRHVLALSLATGERVWEVTFPRGIALLGAVDGAVHVQHDGGLTCLDLRSSEEVWNACSTQPPTGVGALANGRVYLPSCDAVSVFEAATGAAVGIVSPPSGKTVRGNLVVTGHALACAAPDGLILWSASPAPSLAGELAPPGAALARVRAALEEGDAETAARRYFELCSEHAMAETPTPWGTASMWTRAADFVRQACEASPALASDWRRQVRTLRESAATAGDVQEFLELVRREPLDGSTAEALLRLGHTLEAAGRQEMADRAFLEALLTGAEPGDVPLGPAAAVESPRAPAPAATLAAPPSNRIAWSRPGMLVPGMGRAAMPDSVLMLETGKMTRVRVTDGQPVWTASLPPYPVPEGLPPQMLESGVHLVGQGYPSWALHGDRLLLALPGGLSGIQPATGEVLWHRAFRTSLARPPARRTVSRMDIIRRALRGLPTRPGRNPTQDVPIDTLAWGPLAVCRVAAASDVTVLDPFTGSVLTEMSKDEERPHHGTLAAVAGGTVCLVSPGWAGPRLSVYDAKDSALLAEWRVPLGTVVNSVTPTGDGRVLVADEDGVFVLDARRLALVNRWSVIEGVDRLLWAGEDIAVARALDGSAVCLDGLSGQRLWHRQRPDCTVVCAGTAGSALYLIEAEPESTRVAYGPQTHVRGRDVRLSAVRAADGRELWTRSYAAASGLLMGPPASAGRWLLVHTAAAGTIRVQGLDPSTGEAAFEVQLDGPRRPRPVPVTVRDGRALVGSTSGVIALEPRKPGEGDPVH